MTSGLATAVADTEVEGPPPRPGRRVSPLGWAIVTLVLIPTVVFGGADLIGGHLLLSGDNLLQSYPLHVLVGADIRHGVMPSWDPWIWSGTPLLAGLNAGAFYPTTLLFAIMNPHAAWVLGEIFIFSSVGVGTCLLFSEHGMSPAAAFLGAFVFAFGGAVAAQASVHTDMAEGLASLPWVLLAIRRIATDGRWRWAVLLGLVFGLAVLAGSPEAILDTAVLGAVYALLWFSVRRDSWKRLLSRGVLAGALAVGLTAAVWLPALHFIASSQRASAPESFAAGYPFPPAAGLLGLVPYLEGGLGLLGQPGYFGQSNLGEVGFYLGILPVIAVISMWTPRWGRRLPEGEQRCWYGVLLVGVVLAVGAGTPLEHLLYQIPFYGKQRDSGRNIVDVDLAASALFAWWVDRTRNAATSRSSWAGRLAFAPLALILAVGVWFALSPASLWKMLLAYPPPASSEASIGAAIALAAGLAVVAGLIASAGRRLGQRRFLAAVGLFTFVDLALFACGSSYVYSQAIPVGASAGRLMSLAKANLSPAGRYGVYDPDLFYPSNLVLAGEPDVGIVNDLPSYSGYGAIVDNRYSLHTRTHQRAFLDDIALRQGVLDPLGAQVLLTVPEAFLVPIGGLPARDGSILPVNEAAGTDPALPGGNEPAPQLLLEPLYLSGPHSAISVGGTLGWYFGTTLDVRRAELTLGHPADGQLVRAGVVRPSGSIAWQAPGRLGSGAATVRLSLPAGKGVGLVVELLHGGALGPARLAVQAGGRSYLVAGSLARAVTPASWTDVGAADNFTVFRSTYTPVAAWVQPATIPERVHGTVKEIPSTSVAASAAVRSQGLGVGSATVVSRPSANLATIDVRTPKDGLLAWSTAWDPGWLATVTPAGGQARHVPVQRIGLVVGVRVPKGSSVVRFSYVPVGFRTGTVVSLASVAITCAAGVALLLRRRRRRGPAREALPAA